MVLLQSLTSVPLPVWPLPDTELLPCVPLSCLSRLSARYVLWAYVPSLGLATVCSFLFGCKQVEHRWLAICWPFAEKASEGWVDSVAYSNPHSLYMVYNALRLCANLHTC